MKKGKEKESKSKKKIWKILLGIVIVIILIILVCFIVSLINKNKMSKNDEKVLNAVQALEKEKVSYVFLEINPKLVITIKNDVVRDVACLNDDCMKIIDKIDVMGKKLSNSIEVIYNMAKDNGLKVDEGVLVKWDGNKDLDLKDLKYVKTEVIDSEKQNELLKEVINNDDIKNKNEIEDYNVKLLNEYKKDNDYGKFYECTIDNKELECHIKKDLVVGYDYNGNDFSKVMELFTKVSPNLEGLTRVFNKFGLKAEDYDEFGLTIEPFRYVYFDGIKFVVRYNGKTANKISFEGVKNCEYFTFDMMDINLAKLNDLKLRYLYEDMIRVGAYEEIPQKESCGKKLCKVQVFKARNYCNQETGAIESRGEDIYSICDTNKKNCKEVTEEEYKLYDENYGYVLDYPICKMDSEGWPDENYYRGKGRGVCREEGNNQLWSYYIE
ncbi:MAG: hypothetical protein K2G03_06725 [Bacilli bacterium]|nr:hypothetical protein [Bacilli bacterium]